MRNKVEWAAIDIPSREERWRTTTADDYQLIFSQKLSLHDRKKKGQEKGGMSDKEELKKRGEKKKGRWTDPGHLERKRKEGEWWEGEGVCCIRREYRWSRDWDDAWSKPSDDRVVGSQVAGGFSVL
jgi:hypothetical protein